MMDSLFGFSALAIASGEKLSQMWKSISSPASATASPHTITLPTSPPFILATNYYAGASGTTSLVMITNGVSKMIIYTGPGNITRVSFDQKSLVIEGNVANIQSFSAIYPI